MSQENIVRLQQRNPDERLIRDYLPGPTPLGEERPRPERMQQRPDKGRPPLRFVWADEIVLELKGGLVDGLLEESGITVLYGESSKGKTFVAVDLACRIACGMPWQGKPTEAGTVLYLAAESPESVKRRFYAWRIRHQPPELRVLVVTSPVDLMNGDTEEIVHLLHGLELEYGSVRLVVIDTLARAMTGNENDPEDMGKFVAACGRLRDEGARHVLIVHHSGKDQARGMRGHSCLRAAIDHELEITGERGAGVVTATKLRDGEAGQGFGFTLDRVEIGTNNKGTIVTTCVVSETDPLAQRANPPARPTGKNQKLAYDALTAAIADKGALSSGAKDIPPNVRGVPIDLWREYFERYLPETEPKHRATRFREASAALCSAGFARHVSGFCWLGGGQ